MSIKPQPIAEIPALPQQVANAVPLQKTMTCDRAGQLSEIAG